MIASPRAFFLFSAIVALLAAALLLPGLGGGFVLDDRANIIENGSLQLAERGGSFQDVLYAVYSFQPGNGSRALTMATFALDYWRSGLDARAFKITNIVIHVLTTVFLAFFLRKFLLVAGWSSRRAAGSALFLALLWAIHPLQISSVLYVVQRMQTLVTLFMILALWAYLCLRAAQIDGKRARLYGILCILFWVLGFASKEDALLLPLYALLLELTVLGFRGAGRLRSGFLVKIYCVLVLLGALVYIFWLLPRFWSWGAYPGRDFSSYERLLTQARVLMGYMIQVVTPFPELLRFYYDDLIVSRGIVSPASTLPAIIAIVSIIILAWRWRGVHPIFSFGVLFFFAGHSMTSNILNLELAFEHRNHLPMIGVMLAIFDLVMMALAGRSVRWARIFSIAICLIVVFGMSVATVARARDWGEPLRFASRSVEVSPHSERAWLQLANAYRERSGNDPADPNYEAALAACIEGARITDSVPLISNVVIYKATMGYRVDEDWLRLKRRLSQVPMTPQNRNVLWVMLDSAESGVALDERQLIGLIDILEARSPFSAAEELRVAAYIHNETHYPGESLAHLRHAVRISAPHDPRISKLFEQLREAGRGQWVLELEQQVRQGE